MTATLAPGLRMLTAEEFEDLEPEDQVKYLSLVRTLEAQWRLQARQAWADELADWVDELLFGGALGGGKSELVVYRAHQLSLAVPNHQSLILRESFPQLRRSIIRRSIMRIPKSSATYRVGEKEWHYPNGSVIELGYLDSDEDVRNYLSAEYDAIFIDEATSFSSYQVTTVASRLRTTYAKTQKGVHPHLFLTTNPGGPGHGYCKARYVDATEYGSHIAIYNADDAADDPSTKPVDLVPLPPLPSTPDDWEALDALREVLAHFPALSEDELTVAFVPSALDDNRYLDKSYRRNVARMPEIERRQAQGDWDVFAGQYFTEFSREHHVVAPFEIPENWYRGRGLDYGYTAPYCCLWGAWDPDGNCYIYRESYETKLTPSEQAALVRSMSKRKDERDREVDEEIRVTVADPSVFSTTGVGDPIASQWQHAGLTVRRANSARIDGWTNVREYLRVQDPDEPGEIGKPRLFIFDTCANLIRTLPGMIHSKTTPEDLDSKTEDHAVDALRYLLAVRPMRAVGKRKRRRGSGLEAAAERDFERTTKLLGRRGRRGGPWRMA